MVRDNIKYKYDIMGNITEVIENGLSVAKYEYDALGRLKREDSKRFAKTTLFSYDDNGNILAKYEYAFTNVKTDELNNVEPTKTIIYGYDNDSDRLLTIDDRSKETVDIFEYDKIGNPTVYRGKRIERSHGREMTGFNGNTFSYDARGRRIRKNDIIFTYDSNGKLIKQSNGLEFIYDHTGLLAVEYNGSRYFYRKNAQNDIIALLDNDGNIVVKYTYDAWGVCDTIVLDDNATDIANLNPFRYRSYYLDTGLNLYYLKTRYYDPEICRFITIDDISYLAPDTINGLNLYAYCGNNPILNFDPTGRFPLVALLIGIGIGALVGATFSGVSSSCDGNSGKALVADVIEGALIGATLGAATTLGGLVAVGEIAGMAAATSFGVLTASSYAVGIGNYAISQSLNNDEFNLSEARLQGKQLVVKSVLNFGIGYLYGITGMWSTLNQGVYTNMYRDFRDAGYKVLSSIFGAAFTYLTTGCKEIVVRAGMRKLFNQLWDSVQRMLLEEK